MPAFSKYLTLRSVLGILLICTSILVLEYWTDASWMPWASALVLALLACLCHPNLRWAENYVYVVVLALTLCYVVFFSTISEQIGSEATSYIHIALIILFVLLGFILPLRRYTKTRRWTKQHNKRVHARIVPVES